MASWVVVLVVLVVAILIAIATEIYSIREKKF